MSMLGVWMSTLGVWVSVLVSVGPSGVVFTSSGVTGIV